MRGIALLAHAWVAACALLSVGCALFTSWNDVMGTWVGEPIESITSLWGPPTKVWTREDDKTIYKYDAKDIDPSCIHYWIVNDQNVIVDFYYEGFCRPV